MKYNSANMNTLIKSCLTLCLLWSAIGSHAQVIKKSDTDDSKKTNNQLSVRAQSLYDTQDASDADIPWMRVIYRQIDLNKEKNMPLYYPEESTENQENLFRIVMKLLANNQIPAYEYLDGREIFTDEYRIKVKEMFGKGDTFSRKQLKHLQELSLIEWHGSNKSDPTQYYSLRKDV
jgi:hypothetical protein